MNLKDVLQRLNGISTPIGGLNWTPSVDERQVVYKLVQQLADRRLIWPSGHGDFHYEDAIRSLGKMREHVTDALGVLQPEVQSRKLLEEMRLALQLFQSFLEKQYPAYKDIKQQRKQYPAGSEVYGLGQSPLKPGVLEAWAAMREVVGERLLALSKNHKILLPYALDRTIAISHEE